MNNYAKVNSQGQVEKYPYTVWDLRRDYPNTSFPDLLNEDTVKDFGVVSVKQNKPFDIDHTKNQEVVVINTDGGWMEQWNIFAASLEEITERTDTEKEVVRQQRNALLSESDWTQLSDVSDVRWVAYRQALRDLTEQKGFPWNVTWPEKP